MNTNLIKVLQIDTHNYDTIGVFDDYKIAQQAISDLLSNQPNFKPVTNGCMTIYKHLDTLQRSLCHEGAWYSELDKTLICIQPLVLNVIEVL